MNTKFLVFIAVLGAFVIASYIWAFRSGSGNLLWGGVPEKARGIYVASMILSALAYFVFSTYFLFKIDFESFHLFDLLDSRFIYLVYFLLLLPSAVWTPLTAVMVANPSTAVWVLIRAVLFSVGLSSLAIFVMLLGIQPEQKDLHYWASVVGAAIFFLHTGVLDAFVWPAFFKV